MNPSILFNTPYINRYQAGYGKRQDENSQTVSKSQEMRTLLRNLQRTQAQSANPYSVMPKSKVDELLESSGVSEKEEKKERAKNSKKYNYKEVSLKIQQAKNSLSAGRAVLSAKRKVLEVRRQIAKGDGDEEELQLALAHAKKMEMTARKKKHNLELEEMIEATQKRDENMKESSDQVEKAVSNMQTVSSELAQDEVWKKEDAVFEEREELFDSIQEQLQERNASVSDEMMAELNEMIAEFGEEELKALEEEMEMLEIMEVADPHMSEEELEELKRKHRSAESKALVKADMDYLKGIIKHGQETGKSMFGVSSGSQPASVSFFSVTVDSFDSSSISFSSSMQAPSIDIQI